jgi:hypothetical protein
MSLLLLLTPSGTDDTAAIQAAIDGVARGRGYRILLAPGIYKISSTLIIPGHVELTGYGAQPGSDNQGGTELSWIGADGGTAVRTAVDEETDWSRGRIRDLRISREVTMTTGIGLHVRNATNAAQIENVFVTGFPTTQILIEETKEVPAYTPGYVRFERMWAAGGVTPIRIKTGVQGILLDTCAVDGDATTTAMFTVELGLTGNQKRFSCVFINCKAEDNNGVDCIGLNVTTGTNVTVIGTHMQKMVAGTKAAYRQTSGDAEMIILTSSSLNFAYWYENTANTQTIAPTAVGTPFSRSFPVQGHPTFIGPFGVADLAAGVSGAGVRAAAMTTIAESGGLVMPQAGTLVSITARVNAAINSGSVTPKVIKNGATFMGQVTLNAANQQGVANITNNATARFAAGDRLGAFYDSDAGLLPVGSLDLVVVFFVRFDT